MHDTLYNTAIKRPKEESERIVLQKTNWPFLLLLFVAAIYLYVNLFRLPNTPVLLGGDQVYFWMDAQRMLNGERIYQDFFRYTPPGTDLLYVALFRLFGSRLWVTNTAVLAMGVAFCWICFSISTKIMKQSSALLATVLFIVFVYGRSLNGTNHWFSALAIAAAVNVSMSDTTAKRLAAAGALLGLAAFFNQAHGVAALVGFTFFLLWNRSRSTETLSSFPKFLASLFLGFTAVILLLSAHFIAETGLRQLWYFQVTYVLQYSARQQSMSLGLPATLAWRNLPALLPSLLIYSLLPVVYCTTLRQSWRHRKDLSFPWNRIALLSLVGSFLLMEVAVSINWLRLYAVSIPGIILLLWTIDRLQNIRRYAAISALILTIAFAARQAISSQTSHTVRADFPGGIVAVTPLAYEKLSWIQQHTQPGEFFLQAGWPGMYLPLQLRNPLYVATLSHLDAARPEDIELAIQQLKTKRVRLILWTQYLDSQCGSGQPCEVLLPPLRDYLNSSYTRIRIFSDGDSLWQRNE